MSEGYQHCARRAKVKLNVSPNLAGREYLSLPLLDAQDLKLSVLMHRRSHLPDASRAQAGRSLPRRDHGPLPVCTKSWQSHREGVWRSGSDYELSGECLRSSVSIPLSTSRLIG